MKNSIKNKVREFANTHASNSLDAYENPSDLSYDGWYDFFAEDFITGMKGFAMLSDEEIDFINENFDEMQSFIESEMIEEAYEVIENAKNETA